MHLLAPSSTTLDELIEPTDLRQPAGDVAVLSFADSDLAAIAAAWALEREVLPSVRLAHLRDLRHPLSVDLWVERVGRHAKVILVRLLGGLDWWRYGIEQLSAQARERAIALAVLPGEDRDDPRLAAASTLPPEELALLLGFFRAGGRENLRGLLRRLAGHAGLALKAAVPRPLPNLSGYLPHEGAVDLETLIARLSPAWPVVPILFYRAALLAADTAPIDSLCEALAARRLAAAPLVVTSLKEPQAARFVTAALAQLNPAVIITTTGFAAAANPGEPTPLDGPAVPVLQAVIASTKRAAWEASPRGLGAADLAMHVVLPELDGRLLAGAIAFKHPLATQEGLAFTALANRPEPDRVAMVADRAAAIARLQQLPRSERRIAILMPQYPGAPGRTGYAVGLDVPSSIVALIADLSQAGYTIQEPPPTARALIEAVSAAGDASLSLGGYARLMNDLPPEMAARVGAAWGDPTQDPDAGAGAFRFRARAFGNLIVALPPERGRAQDRRADYHDPALPPRHALLAFALWLRHVARIDAIVHMGAHGTLEWLPGKAVALTAACFPDALVGPLPVIYPFIVSNPGEAAQAKRRIAALTIGHLPPPLAPGELSGEIRELERLIDEYAQADGFDTRRRERLAIRIVEAAHHSGLARAASIDLAGAADEVLRRIDAWLCDLKDLAIKDGLHVYGRAAPHAGSLLHMGAEEEKCAAAERSALLAALDGRQVAPGPAGCPARGRRDVLPTGRNLFTADPRMLPTPTAMELGAGAAEEVIRAHLQAHGEMPRALVLDLWGSATLRTGGEEIAQGLAYLGCRPTWDHATGRVTGVEVLPLATVGRPRIDVTWRMSGLFRDLFPAQIALLHAAVQAVAARAETDEENPLAAAQREDRGELARIFSNAPGAYGAGVSDLIASAADRAAIGAGYLAAASHVYAGAAGEGRAAPGAFARRLAAADLLVHPADDPGRDLLEGGEDVSFVGGLAAAAARLGAAPDLVMLDLTVAQRPRARPLAAALARIVQARAVSPRFIAGQMRHGVRGAAELAETVERLTGFALTTDAVASELFDLLHAAYLADPRVRAFLLRENPAAAREIAERLTLARRRGLWHPRRNDVDADLAAFGAEARS